MKQSQNIRCNSCGEGFKVDIQTFVDIDADPFAKEAVISGEFFLKECPHCGKKQLVKYPLIYVDRKQQLLFCLSDTALKIDDMAGFTGRLVPDAGTLIEKIKIFDAGLDDIAVEMCKFITVQELGKQVELKFFKTEGSENDLIFTYPENGQMQMLSVGLNVYEDCRKILQRNPAVEESAKGLVRIDREWLSTFLA